MIYVDPMDLLPEHRSLLDVDFDKLADSPAEDKQLWLAEMDSAIAGANDVVRGLRQALHSCYATGPHPRLDRVRESVAVDTEGSIRWRRRRRRD